MHLNTLTAVPTKTHAVINLSVKGTPHTLLSATKQKLQVVKAWEIRKNPDASNKSHTKKTPPWEEVTKTFIN